MKSWWKPALLVGVAALSMGVGIQAQRTTQGASDPQPTELLQEVRALRVALERFTVAGTRSQLLLGRLQMQEARIVTLGRQAREIRAQLLEVRRDRETNAVEIKKLSEGLHQIPSLDERRAMEQRIESIARSDQRLQRRERELQVEDTTATEDLAAEQSRWHEFNQRLEELERVLAGVRQ